MYTCLHSLGNVDQIKLLEIARHFSPLVEVSSKSAVIIESSGLGYLFGGPQDLSLKIQEAAKQQGIDVSLAMAENPDLALLAAYNIDGINIIGHGGGQSFLSQLPVTVLRAFLMEESENPDPPTFRPGRIDPKPAQKSQASNRSQSQLPMQMGRSVHGQSIRPDKINDIFQTLDLWGISTLGDLAELPEDGLAQTLGTEGLLLQRLARGSNKRALNYVEEKPVFVESVELDSPIELIEQLTFVISGIMHRLCLRLSSQGFATNEINLSAQIENLELYQRRLQLPFPMAGPHWISRLLALEVESQPPTGPLINLTLSAIPVKPRQGQQSLFDSLQPEPEKIELTIARLARLVSRQKVGAIEIHDDHKPESFDMKVFSINKKFKRTRHGTQVRKERALTGFKVFRPPAQAKIRIQLGKFDHLKCVASTHQLTGRVVFQSGPWAASGHWWSSTEQWAREEWDLGLADGTLCRVFQNLVDNQWYVEGVYD